MKYYFPQTLFSLDLIYMNFIFGSICLTGSLDNLQQWSEKRWFPSSLVSDWRRRFRPMGSLHLQVEESEHSAALRRTLVTWSLLATGAKISIWENRGILYCRWFPPEYIPWHPLALSLYKKGFFLTWLGNLMIFTLIGCQKNKTKKNINIVSLKNYH